MDRRSGCEFAPVAFGGGAPGLVVDSQLPRNWDEIIHEMVLPKRCVNNKIALKKIIKTVFGQVRESYFHGEEKVPTKRRTTRSGIIGGGQSGCCTRCRRFKNTAITFPQMFTSRRRSLSRMNLGSVPEKLCHSRRRMKCSKSNSVPRDSSTPSSGCASRIGKSTFRHFTSQPGNVDHFSRINSQLLQKCPDEGRQRDHHVLYTAVAHRNVHPEPSSLESSEVNGGVP
ncbi:uncharacterized protein LOC119771206 isoform X2 [Culex quinquefasciatus]|uniref:uncharacterized protein LOC119771206 isoform X1 n=1 Tax=Culex quinquefasciatus TaxID=7176 RepID=UPI0018E34674|nr:uncharacterized protein LOC119771206 isoform X1 [Culex quinquefasciatus]XP_038122819.1 uncharacterized protein LOC119771206 isoform X2 [Culex quinquefasciatus]